MLLRALLVPALLIGSLAFVTADEADASPFDAPRLAFGGVYVSGGVAVPVRAPRRRRARVRTVREVGGYYKTVYETRIERVWHPRELIGRDSHGRLIYSPGHWDEIEVQVPVQVWVPRRRIVRRVVRRPARRPVGHIAIGGTVRIR